MFRQPVGPRFATAPAARPPILRLLVCEDQARDMLSTYSPPIVPAAPANPFARARYFRGRTSEGIDCTMEIVARVVPMRMPPPISMLMEVAFAQTTAPTHAITGGMVANSFRSSTSDSRPTRGDKTDCIKRGPWACEHSTQSLIRTLYLDDPTRNGGLAEFANDEGQDGACCNNNEDLGHDAGACQTCPP